MGRNVFMRKKEAREQGSIEARKEMLGTWLTYLNCSVLLSDSFEVSMCV